MSEDTLIPTRGQIERDLSQRIQALYRRQLGHQTGKISCQIFDEKIAIILEESVTKPEQLLASNGQEKLAEHVHLELDEIIQPQVKAVIEEVLDTPVLDLLSHAKLETGRTGAIAILAAAPKFREPSSPSKVNKQSEPPLV